MTGTWDIGSIGIMPGVLFRVTRQCSLGVFSNAHFAEGFCDSMIAGVSVRCGIVMMGVSLITLCYTSRASSPTLCSSTGGGGCRILLLEVHRRYPKYSRLTLLLIPLSPCVVRD
jgi:hypothetical protein